MTAVFVKHFDSENKKKVTQKGSPVCNIVLYLQDAID